MRFLIAFFAVRSFRYMPSVSPFEVCDKLRFLINLHGIRFEETGIRMQENNPLVYWEGITDAPKNFLPYKDIINVDYEDNYIFILLRSGYYHRLSKWGTERIYDHLYWDRTKGKENWLMSWWYRL